MSMDARGAFGGTIVFSGWKGRQTVRKLVTPSNPKSAGQETARNAVKVLGAGQHWANTPALKASGETLTDKELLIAAAPSGQAWNGFLVKSGIGAGQIQYDAATSAYSALAAGEKTAWEDAAAALTPAIPAVAQTDAGGAAGTPLTDGEVFFHYAYGLYVAGIATVPGAVPPVYA
jgi:hypothetical protein